MSHSTISATRDYIPGRDKGDLTDPAQAASFTSDPLLDPVTTSSLPRPMLPDPTPSDNPELFDKSTSHPNTHYHPDAKLSKKKRAKKLGTGYMAKPHHAAGGVQSGGRTFSEHEKEAHERAERRDAAIGPAAEEHEEEWETDEDDEAQQDEQSHRQHHENRMTGTEKGQSPPTGKRDQDVVDSLKQKGNKDQKEGQKQDEDQSDNPSLMQRASNVLSSAQQKATGVVSGVTSSVMSTAQSVPVVGALLSKVGLGGAKSDDKAHDAADDTADDKVDSSSNSSGTTGGTQGQSGGNNDARSKVGGAKEAATEATQAGGSEQSTKEAATNKAGGEMYGKQGARQDNHEGALDKSRSHQGQKHVDNMKAA